MASIYNSRNTACKKPFGAVTAGQAVTFTLRIPLSYASTTPHLLLQKDGEEAKAIPLVSQGREADEDIFTLTISADTVGLYFYWFDLWVDFQKLYMGMQGEAVVSREPARLWQLTVYDPAFQTPQSTRGGVMYQIFPDRFFEGNPNKSTPYNERVYRPDKRKEPYFWPMEQEAGYLTQDYFGGDLVGIEHRLAYLHSLGVTWIYLNPIFEAHSNHRYNTADYLNIDPHLGTNDDFVRLCETAKTFNIKIMLDGVFNHTGSDSLYFNKEARYPTHGAHQGPASPYRSWFKFHPDGSYDSWWGFTTLPACNAQNPEFREFICGENGVIDTWMSRGASGFRLDVADELPDDFIAEMRTAIKAHGEDNLLIGEVWEDASNKTAYDVRRQYLWGKELDGVMNYPFRTAILHFLSSFDAPQFADCVMAIVENYPPPAMAATTNHISTHDSVRAITAMAGEPLANHDRNWQSGRTLSEEEYHLGILRMQLAFVLQFTLPGIPCVYYGDEIAMQGYKDPFNRAYYNWHSGETRLIPLMISLSALRKSCAAFKEGSLRFVTAQNGVLVYERAGGGAKAAIALNCSAWPAPVNLLGKEFVVPVMEHAIHTSFE